MSYQETIEYLFKSTPVFEHVGASAYKEGLDNSLAMDAFLGHPHQKYKTVHVAGTNGKGSCSHTLASILQTDGHKVGLYTSPHLIDFRERIKVNGVCISESYVVDFVEKYRSFFEPLHPSFFELTTAMAFKYFADCQVDIAIIEVGLGGRLDCTNIITPILSVITNISLDHVKFLGNTLGKIAREKAGIIKKNVPVIIGENNSESKPVFIQRAKELNAPIVLAEDLQNKIVISSKSAEAGGRMYHLSDGQYVRGDLMGDYQEKNMNTVLVAAKELKRQRIIKNEEAITKGIGCVVKQTGLLGRWQCLGKKPYVICDTGHNSGGWKYLSRQIAQQPGNTKRIVFGMVDDKDLDTVMTMLPKDGTFYWTQPSTHRAFPVEKIAACGVRHGLTGSIFHDVMSAYNQALSDAKAEDFVFIGGSSYIVADLQSGLLHTK
ncbi:bifunctional folylpolyglutamate synthase/dihydrofolate synthase [Prevotella sp. A2931]|uniref:Dihydrofolate synthase/folylpolyglutamate synthase n=1 Tax=Prevotella illustrans TaxID=2800387 RepID=A0ABS3M2K1_9BACT|nr:MULTISPECIES: folylpolyglutamate synthase/dihydrofolate synthase family protein [Prevotella]MBO1362374.1 bifunctional folylpolyglutamate synthase/dihydrofolate synthase [Prevotella illustrans]PTL25107.1 dihydrofolate synthase [Prevotella sp. oral taxon 820]